MRLLALLLLVLSLTFVVHAQEIDCDDENNLAKIAKGITYPNCYTADNLKTFQNRDNSSLCSSCKKDFELVHGKITENKSHLQEEFFEATLKEYKKNISNSLINAVKLKVLYQTGVDFKKSIASCKMKTSQDLSRTCRSESAKKLLSSSSFFDDLKIEMANDLAKFLSTAPTFKPEPTILKRSEQSCFIPEKDILMVSASTYEEALSPDLIEFIKKANLSKFKTTTDMFASEEFLEEFGDQITEIGSSLRNHPLLSSHMSSPAKFVQFLNKVPSPVNTSNLRKALYSKENGDQFDSELSENCETSFKALQESICSEEFEQGKLFNDPANNFAKLKAAAKPGIDSALASSEEMVDLNIKLLELCENKDGKDKKNLTMISGAIGSSLTELQKSQALNVFKTEKYNTELGSLNKTLCEMNDSTCVEGTMNCAIYKKYKESLIQGSTQFKLANSSNKEVNALLRSMIGDTSRIDPKTKEILVAQGIIPKDDGTLIAQPDIPERKPEFFAQEQASKPAVQQAKLSQSPGNQFPTAVASNSRRPASEREDSSNPVSSSYSNANSLPDFSDLMGDQFEELKGVQDEIRRRLGDFGTKKPATESEAKKIVNEAFKARGKKATPAQQSAFADRIMQSQVPDQIADNSIRKTQDIAENRASVSNTQSQLDKWRAGQKDAALMGMAGAQQVTANDIINAQAAKDSNKPKDLTKVALNLAEDPRVTLSDIFRDKFDKNDPETQLLKVLLRSKNNFLLQIKEMNFKVVFDEKSNFNILLESGDRKEAERIRPQLEMFLKKLKA